MATTTPDRKNDSAVPNTTSLIGIDAEGRQHYATPPTHGTPTIYILADGDLDTFDLADHPDDEFGIGDWIRFVREKVGWDVQGPGEWTDRNVSMVPWGEP